MYIPISGRGGIQSPVVNHEPADEHGDERSNDEQCRGAQSRMGLWRDGTQREYYGHAPKQYPVVAAAHTRSDLNLLPKAHGLLSCHQSKCGYDSDNYSRHASTSVTPLRAWPLWVKRILNRVVLILGNVTVFVIPPMGISGRMAWPTTSRHSPSIQC